MMSSDDTEWSDEELFSHLTMDGRIPIVHYFVMYGEVNEWKPNISLVVTHRYRDENRKSKIIAYLTKRGFVCSSQDRVKELAQKHGWSGWGRPFPLLPPASDGDV